MKLVDANVLLYAVNTAAPHHAVSRRWVEDSLSGGATVGFAWLPLVAFVRLATMEGVLPFPLSVEEAVSWVDEWLAQPPATVVEPGPRHLVLLAELLKQAGSGGNLVNDAHLGALALEHRATITSFDHDFARFPGVRWERPG